MSSAPSRRATSQLEKKRRCHLCPGQSPTLPSKTVDCRSRPEPGEDIFRVRLQHSQGQPPHQAGPEEEALPLRQLLTGPESTQDRPQVQEGPFDERRICGCSGPCARPIAH